MSESVPQFRRVSLQGRTSSCRRDSHSSTNALISTHNHKPSVAIATTASSRCSSDILSDDDEYMSVVDQEEALRMEDFLRQSARASGACLPRAPPRNQLCPHACLELRGLPVSVVVRRLVRFLLAHSIEHGFRFAGESGDGDSDQVRLQCRTKRLLRFCVFLWRTAKDDDDDDCVIVEVQRRRGCPLELHCVRRALFAALQEAEDASTFHSNNNSSSTSLSPCHKMIPTGFCRKVFEKYRPFKTRSDLSIDTACRTEDDDSSCTSESIVNRSKCMLGSPCRQSKELALENMLHLLDLSSSETIADEEQSLTAAAQIILTDESIQQQLLQLLWNRSNGELHTMALQVLAQALRILQTADTASGPMVGLATIVQASSDFWQTVLDCCQTHVSHVTGRNKSPRDAELSIDVLKAVLEEAPQAIMRKEELLLDLAVCHSHGQRYFWALEQKSQDLIDQLQMYQ